LTVTGERNVPTQIHKGIVIDRVDLKSTHEEVDMIIQQMIDAVHEGHTGVAVLSDDTDVFVLLVYYYVVLKLSLCVIMESPVKDRVVTDIKQTAEKHFRIASDLLAAHAVSGCDTVAGYYGIGKSKVIKMLQAGYSLKSVGGYNG